MFLSLQEQCCRVLVEKDAFVKFLTFLLGPLSSSGSKNVRQPTYCNNCIQYLYYSIHIVGILFKLENLFLYFLYYLTCYGIPTSHNMRQIVRHINDITVQPLIAHVC